MQSYSSASTIISISMGILTDKTDAVSLLHTWRNEWTEHKEQRASNFVLLRQNARKALYSNGWKAFITW